MTDQDDQEYFEKRARDERALAGHSPDHAVALTHSRFAEAYERRAREAPTLKAANH